MSYMLLLCSAVLVHCMLHSFSPPQLSSSHSLTCVAPSTRQLPSDLEADAVVRRRSRSGAGAATAVRANPAHRRPPEMEAGESERGCGEEDGRERERERRSTIADLVRARRASPSEFATPATPLLTAS
jgi:hypothetical protein